MSKEPIIAILVLLVIAGALGGGYQFYFKAQMQKYSDDKAELERVEQRITQLENRFQKTVPDVIIAEYKAAVQPWADALRERSSFFSMDDVFKVQPIPQNRILKFYYREEMEAMVAEAQNAAYTKYPPCSIPPDVFDYFGVPTFDDLRGSSPTEEDVTRWLKRLRYGIEMTRLLIDNGAAWINELKLWPKRTAYDGLLEYHTAGYSFGMNMENLVKFLDSLRRADRYFSVDALIIKNRNLRWPYNAPPYPSQSPVLEIEMLLTRTQLAAEEEPEEEAAPEDAGETAPSAATAIAGGPVGAGA